MIVPHRYAHSGGSQLGKNADAIAEGEAIAMAAARLALKNRILVATVGQGRDFDPAVFDADAIEVLENLALEASDASAHLRHLWHVARTKRHESTGTHDYRAGDVKNLKKRSKQSAGVADRLRNTAASRARVRHLVESARDAAWHDVELNLARTLDVSSAHPEHEPDYERMRDARMQALAQIDLQMLAAQQKARQRQAEKAVER